MALYDTLLVNGTDVAAHARVVETWSGTMRSAAYRGENLVFPGVAGATYVPKVAAVTTLSVGLVVLGINPTTGAAPATQVAEVQHLNANWRALLALVTDYDTPLTLIRRVSLPTGDIEESALAELAGVIEPDLVGTGGARCVLDFTILSGAWALVTP